MSPKLPVTICITIARIQVKHTWVLKEWNMSSMYLRVMTITQKRRRKPMLIAIPPRFERKKLFKTKHEKEKKKTCKFLLIIYHIWPIPRMCTCHWLRNVPTFQQWLRWLRTPNIHIWFWSHLFLLAWKKEVKITGQSFISRTFIQSCAKKYRKLVFME